MQDELPKEVVSKKVKKYEIFAPDLGNNFVILRLQFLTQLWLKMSESESDNLHILTHTCILDDQVDFQGPLIDFSEKDNSKERCRQ